MLAFKGADAIYQMAKMYVQSEARGHDEGVDSVAEMDDRRECIGSVGEWLSRKELRIHSIR